jgi:homoserine O-acetyltransferase
MVQSQRLLIEHLGIDTVDLVIGASMGGMQALQWGASHPTLVRRIVAMTPMAKTTAWASAVNRAARLALQCQSTDPLTKPNQLAKRWKSWSAIMQMLCSRTPASLDSSLSSPNEVDVWLEDRTQSWIVQGFDPLDWIYQSWAYEDHDVGMSPGYGGNTIAALRSIRAPTRVFVSPLDLYNPVEAASWAASHISNCEFVEVASIAGDGMASLADPVAAAQLNQRIGAFIA